MKILKLLWCFFKGLIRLVLVAIGFIFVIPVFIVALILALGGDDRLFDNGPKIFEKFFFHL